MAQEVECWTLHLVGGVATTTRVYGSNPEEAGVSHLNLKLFVVVYVVTFIEINVCPPHESNNKDISKLC